MQERLLDLDADGERRALAARHHPIEDLVVLDDPRAAVDAQGVLAAGDQEDQPDVRVLEDVAHTVELLVAEPVGDGEAMLVEHQHEPGRVALRRDVAATRGAGRCEQQERRPLDERATVLVEPGLFLQESPLARVTEHLAQSIL